MSNKQDDIRALRAAVQPLVRLSQVVKSGGWKDGSYSTFETDGERECALLNHAEEIRAWADVWEKQ